MISSQLRCVALSCTDRENYTHSQERGGTAEAPLSKATGRRTRERRDDGYFHRVCAGAQKEVARHEHG